MLTYRICSQLYKLSGVYLDIKTYGRPQSSRQWATFTTVVAPYLETEILIVNKGHTSFLNNFSARIQ